MSLLGLDLSSPLRRLNADNERIESGRTQQKSRGVVSLSVFEQHAAASAAPGKLIYSGPFDSVTLLLGPTLKSLSTSEYRILRSEAPPDQ